jgi:hypothetical protein
VIRSAGRIPQTTCPSAPPTSGPFRRGPGPNSVVPGDLALKFVARGILRDGAGSFIQLPPRQDAAREDVLPLASAGPPAPASAEMAFSSLSRSSPVLRG